MISRLAASDIELIIVTGMPISKGQGVATTKTARKRSTSPLIAHALSATIIANGV